MSNNRHVILTKMWEHGHKKILSFNGNLTVLCKVISKLCKYESSTRKIKTLLQEQLNAILECISIYCKLRDAGLVMCHWNIMDNQLLLLSHKGKGRLKCFEILILLVQLSKGIYHYLLFFG